MFKYFRKQIKKMRIRDIAVLKSACLIMGVVLGAFISSFVKDFWIIFVAVFVLLYAYLLITFFKK